MASLLFYCLLLLDALLPPTNAIICFGGPDLASLVKIAQGRAALLLIKEGTQESQVKYLLGRSRGEFWFGAGAVEVDYSHYGLGIWYDFSLPDRKVTYITVYRLATSLDDNSP